MFAGVLIAVEEHNYMSPRQLYQLMVNSPHIIIGVSIYQGAKRVNSNGTWFAFNYNG